MLSTGNFPRVSGLGVEPPYQPTLREFADCVAAFVKAGYITPEQGETCSKRALCIEEERAARTRRSSVAGYPRPAGELVPLEMALRLIGPIFEICEGVYDGSTFVDAFCHTYAIVVCTARLETPSSRYDLDPYDWLPDIGGADFVIDSPEYLHKLGVRRLFLREHLPPGSLVDAQNRQLTPCARALGLPQECAAFVYITGGEVVTDWPLVKTFCLSQLSEFETVMVGRLLEMLSIWGNPDVTCVAMLLLMDWSSVSGVTRGAMLSALSLVSLAGWVLDERSGEEGLRKVVQLLSSEAKAPWCNESDRESVQLNVDFVFRLIDPLPQGGFPSKPKPRTDSRERLSTANPEELRLAISEALQVELPKIPTPPPVDEKEVKLEARGALLRHFALVGLVVELGVVVSVLAAIAPLFIALVDMIVELIAGSARYLTRAVQRSSLRARRWARDRPEGPAIEVDTSDAVPQSGLSINELLIANDLGDWVLIGDVLLSAARLAESPTRNMLALEVLGYVKKHGLCNPLGIDQDVVMAMVEEAVATVIPQSNNPLLDSAYEVLTALSIGGVLRKLAVNFEWVQIAKIQSMLQEVVRHEEDFLRKVTAFLRELVLRLVEAIRTRSLAPFSLQTVSVDRWLEYSRVLLDDARIRESSSRSLFETHKRDGDIPAFFTVQLSQDGRVALARKFLTDVEYYRQALSLAEIRVGTSLEINRMASRLENFIREEMNRKANSRYRFKPAGVYLHGLPDVGKTTVTSLMADIVALRSGAETGADITYHAQADQGFDNGASPFHKFVVMDDLDQFPGKPQYADQTWAKLVIRLLNTAPYMTNQAALEKKGEVFLVPWAVVFVTNAKPTQRLVSDMVNAPVAFFRRFNYAVEMCVSDEFDNGAGGLRKDIPVRDDTWRFNIKRYSPTHGNLRDPVYYTLERTITSVHEFARWFDQELMKTVQEGTNFSESLNRRIEGCPVCGLPQSAHCGVQCVEPVAQADEPVASETPSSPLGNDLPPAPLDTTNQPSPAGVDFESVGRAAAAALLCSHWLWGLWNGWFLLLLAEALLVLLTVSLSKRPDLSAKLLMLLAQRAPLPFVTGAIVAWLFPLEVRMTAARTVSFGVASYLGERWIEYLKRILSFLSFSLASWYAFKTVKRVVDDMRHPRPDVEAAVGAEDPIEVTPTGSGNVWHRPPIKHVPFPARRVTTTLDQFTQSASRLFALVRAQDGRTVYAAHYSGFDWIFPKHIFYQSSVWQRSVPLPPGEHRFVVTYVGQEYVIILEAGRNVSEVAGRDYVIARFPSIVPSWNGCRDFIAPDAPTPSTIFDRAVLIVPKMDLGSESLVNMVHLQSRLTIVASKNSPTGAPLLLSGQCATESGDCGSLYLGMHGTSLRVIGGHVAAHTGLLGSSTAFGELFATGELDSARAKLHDPLSLLEGNEKLEIQSGQLVSDGSGGAFSDVRLTDIPAKSSFNSVFVDGVLAATPLGTIPKFHNSSFSTKLYETPWRSEIDALARECGVEPDYVLPREVKRMRDVDVRGSKVPRWTDATTVYLRKGREQDGPRAPLEWALRDYLEDLDGLACEIAGARPMDVFDVIRGGGEQWINSLNLKTSTGLPHSKPKSHFFRWVEGQSAELEAEINDVVLQEFLAVEKAMLEDPSLVVMHCFKAVKKDEPVSREKVEDGKLRIFWVGPVVFQLLMMKYWWPVMVLFLDHPEYFEHLLGVNICSPAADELVHRILTKAESLDAPAVYDGDLSGQDTCSANQYLHTVGSGLREILEKTAYTQEELSMARRIFLGGIYRIHVVNGDVYMTASGNVSGWWLTALVNTFGNSILQRSAWYIAWKRTEETEPPRFRSVVAAVNLGDDNEGGVAKEHRARFNCLAIRDGMAAYGQTYTSSSKEKEFTAPLRPLRECSILKRRFVYDADIGHFVAPLEPKSIFKMLSFGMESSSASRSEVLRDTIRSALVEASLHGAEFYDSLVSTLLAHPDSRDLLGQAPPRDYFVERLKSGQDLWSWPTETPEVDTSDVVIQSGEAPISDVVLTTPLDRVNSAPAPPAIPLPFSEEEGLAHFLERPIRIGSQTIANTDSVGWLTNFSLIEPFFTNAAVDRKVSNYWFYRGNFEVTAVMEAPNTSMGAYVLSTWCDTTSGCALSGSDATLYPIHATMQRPFAIMNPAMNNKAVFTLPFISPYDSAAITSNTALAENRWTMAVHCLAPITDTIQGSSAATSGTITFFVRAVPGFKLGGVIPQARFPTRAQRPSSFLEKASSVVGSISNIVPSISALAEPVKMGLSAASELASALGYTRHRMGAEESRMVPVRAPYLGPSDGTDSSVVFGLSHTAQTSIDPLLGGASSSTDQCSFGHLFGKDTYLGATMWTPSHAYNYTLACLPVTPGLCAPADGGGLGPSPMGYFGALAQNWRGSLTFGVHVVCGPTHAGTLLVFWSRYPYTVGSTIGTDINNAAHACLVDISTDLTMEFDVHWNSNRVACDMHLGTADQQWPLDSTNGYLVVAVGSPLRATATSTHANVLMYYRGGEDLCLGGLRMYTSRSSGTNLVPVEHVLRLQAEESVEVERCSLVGNPGVRNLDKEVFGEVISSVRVFAQKFSLHSVTGLRLVVSTSPGRPVVSDVCVPFYPDTGGSATSTWGGTVDKFPEALTVTNMTGAWTNATYNQIGYSHLGWAKAAFVGIRGGMLYKLIPRYTGSNSPGLQYVKCAAYLGARDRVTAQGYVQDDGAWGVTSIGFGNAIDETSGSGAFEFYCPYSADRKFLTGFVPYTSSSDGKWTKFYICWSPTVTSETVDIGIVSAGAADINFIEFRCTPKIVASATII